MHVIHCPQLIYPKSCSLKKLSYLCQKKSYIQEIIRSDLEEAGHEDVFRKIKKDFQAASITVEETEIRDQMEKALSRAKEDFKK